MRRRAVRQGRGRRSCATASRSARARRRRCGSPSPAPTAASPTRASSSLRRSSDPDAQLAAKTAARDALAARSRVDLPGDRKLQEALDWGKQNLADLTQTATNLQIRFVDQGKAYPGAGRTTSSSATFIGAGYPDYPWLFATDGEYTAFAAVALGQFEAIKDHLIALRDVSDALNARSGKVAHEIVTDGSVYFGANTDAGNTDETAKFPSAVALVWRWTGDDRFRDRLYDFSGARLQLRHRQARRRQGRLARGPGQRRARRHGRRRSSTTPST